MANGSRRSPELEGYLPGLASGDYEITSDESGGYNCIAWAADDQSQNWWPGVGRQAHWPTGAPQACSLDAFEAAYSTLGYERCDNGDPEEGCEKVAIFASDAGEPTHAARQLPSGRWTSKLGKAEDIEHNLLDVEGDIYGTAARFMRRERSS